MDWLSEMRERHRSGYVPAGICLSCRRGEAGCIGGRFGNKCANRIDNTPTKEERLEGYAELFCRLCRTRKEPERGDLLGAAISRRKFLREQIGIAEAAIRSVEDGRPVEMDTENIRIIRRLRWEL